MIVFGPVPSRRLGQSLGVNNIPPKACSYSCVYCQVGATPKPETEPREFYPPATLTDAIRDRLAKLKRHAEAVDFITFVPDGEPTLDIHLGDAIARIKPLGLPVAVITNGSLLWKPEVRNRICLADWVSVKVDAADDGTWRKVNRPAQDLDWDQVRDGIQHFVAEYDGFLATETMLLAGLNDHVGRVAATADLVASLRPDAAFLGMPTRPMAMAEIRPPDGEAWACAFQAFKARVANTEELSGYAEGGFGFGGDVEADLLATTAVHPMSDTDMAGFLAKAGAEPRLLENLIARGLLKRVTHASKTFYIRAREN